MRVVRRRLTRGVLADLSGVHAETIRYYEKIGLMPEPDRSSGGHRLYADVHRQRLCFIRRCRDMDFTLAEIRELLSLVDREQVSCERVLRLADSHLLSIKQKISNLEFMRDSLQELMRHCSGENVRECPFIETLWQKYIDPVVAPGVRIEEVTTKGVNG